jgi:hypothetical protein
MLQAGAQHREAGEALSRLAEQPELLERGLKVLDVGLRLTPELTLDLVLKDAASRPLIALGEGVDGIPALLGRAVCVLVEVRRMRGLLERLFRADGVSFAADPRVVLCVRRAPDALLDASGWLRSLGIELVETHTLPLQGVDRLVVVRAGGESRGPPPATDPPRSTATTKVTTPAKAAAAAPAPESKRTKSDVPLLDLAKKKILRIGDEIEEEVDGDLVRFRLRDEVLAVLETGGELALCLGDAPELRRPIPDRAALEAAVDDVVRRYFSLVRHARPRALNGHAGTA